MNVQEKFAATRREMNAALIERETEIDLALTALVCREHLLLVGPPGTAKSLLCDSLVEWVHGSKFSLLLTKFSTPEEVFGPISLQGLKAGEYRRIVTRMLPEATICFLDEIWKASSAILNTTLKVLNERRYENGATVLQCPLKLAVAASNEWPSHETGKELGALFDRFLFRRSVHPVATEAGRERLLWGDDHTPKLSTSITPAEIDQAHADAMALDWTDEAKDALRAIMTECRREGIIPGDRRSKKAIGAVRSFAYLSGLDHVEIDHLEILAHVLWEDPAEQPALTGEIVGRIANPIGMQINSFMFEANEVLQSVQPKDMATVIGATRKLADIHKALGNINGNGRAAKASAWVASELKRLKMAAVENI